MTSTTLPAGQTGPASPENNAAPSEPTALLRALDGWMFATGMDGDHPWRIAIARGLAADATESRRLEVAQDAMHELFGLMPAILRFLPFPAAETELYVIRGLVRRAQDLHSVVLSVIGYDDGRETNEMEVEVHGEDAAAALALKHEVVPHA